MVDSLTPLPPLSSRVTKTQVTEKNPHHQNNPEHQEKKEDEEIQDEVNIESEKKKTPEPEPKNIPHSPLSNLNIEV